jgi:hypothetical protein
MELRSWVWLINSRCLCHSQLHSHLRIQRGSRPSSVWETNEATEKVISEEDSWEGGREGGRGIAFIRPHHYGWPPPLEQQGVLK